MNLPNGWELILVLLVVVLVFGSKRLPDSARALGRSMRILKAETKGLREDDEPQTRTTAAAVPPVTPVGPSQPVAPSQPVGPSQPIVQSQPVQADPPAVPYAGQQVFDAQGRPVQVQPVPPAPSSQV